MLYASRFRRHFEFIGDKSTHFGIFAGCGSVIPFDAGDPVDSAAAGCC
jgi:hypothetical protein